MIAHHAMQAPNKKWTRPEIFLVCGSVLAIAAIAIIVVSLLIRERRDANEAAARASSNIVSLIDADVLRNAELYDTSLQGMISAWQMPELQNIAPNLRHLVLFDRSTAARYKGDLLLIDKDGRILADSTSVTPRTVNLADRAHFQELRRNPSNEMLVGAPFKSRGGFKDWCISFSRRISGEDGSFQGIASAAMRLVYFKQLFRTLDIGPDSNITLLNTDGVLLARHPEISGKDLIGTSFASTPNFKRIIEEGNGSFSGTSSIDGKERLYTFSHVGDLPLIVVVGQSVKEVYALWHRNVLLVGIATTVLCLGILWLSLLLRRELGLRHQAEEELRARASTDALTGLANRRRLDEVIKSEWMRSIRSGKPVSLLVIDVDHFKAFNDRHGHHGGDEALRNVATTIANHIRRPGDFVARYGGEEFVVVLGETDMEGARAIAEIIRQAVQDIAPYAGDNQPITVSIGIACTEANAGAPVDTLFNTADKALYVAKSNGRNRVEPT
ncbi:sensor domain-containing diguanylate cyclase [Pseudomonas sp. ICMP 561]|uniref:sensor domain-containing diguanylate cyclase n=1 Tax=Pseudomonas sp. ICMP 561 TaxID=1718918 RepID=UPI000C070EE2|nr:sensor domain-containing diguanylate cyclase [Pseudomonas sp. ICMP 561]PHN32663.1 deoxyribonuclease [Pseudomonas sp. ICMP 561]